MVLLDWLKGRPAIADPEAVFRECLRHAGVPVWDRTAKDGVLSFAVIRSIEFADNIARAVLLLPRGGQMLEVPSHNHMVPTQTPRGWRVAANPSLGNTGRNKLINGTIDLKAGDAVQAVLRHADNDRAEWTPQTPDGWTVQMLGKFLPANGYEMGEFYYFKV